MPSTNITARVCSQAALLYLLYLANNSGYLDSRLWVSKSSNLAWPEAGLNVMRVINSFGFQDKKMTAANLSADAPAAAISLRLPLYEFCICAKYDLSRSRKNEHTHVAKQKRWTYKNLI